MNDRAILEQIREQLSELTSQVALVLGSMDLVQNEVRNALSRIASLEQRLSKVESDPPPFRAPMASLTSEERRAQFESIRVAVEHQTEKQTPYIEATARASKMTPYAVMAGIIVSAFVSGVMQNCHASMGGGHSWETSPNNSSAPSGSLSSR